MSILSRAATFLAILLVSAGAVSAQDKGASTWQITVRNGSDGNDRLIVKAGGKPLNLQRLGSGAIDVTPEREAANVQISVEMMPDPGANRSLGKLSCGTQTAKVTKNGQIIEVRAKHKPNAPTCDFDAKPL